MSNGCDKCGGTKICHNCRGEGTVIAETGHYQGQQVPCPVCFGAGYCRFCRGKSQSNSFLHQKGVVK